VVTEEFESDMARVNGIKEILDRKGDWTKNENVYLRRQPNILHNAMKHPLIAFTCRKGWYQGERNTHY